MVVGPDWHSDCRNRAIVGGVVALVASAFSNAGPGPGIPGLAVALIVAGGLMLLASLIVNLVLMPRPSTGGLNRFGPRAGGVTGSAPAHRDPRQWTLVRTHPLGPRLFNRFSV